MNNHIFQTDLCAPAAGDYVFGLVVVYVLKAATVETKKETVTFRSLLSRGSWCLFVCFLAFKSP
jgi:hypothetical protein